MWFIEKTDDKGETPAAGQDDDDVWGDVDDVSSFFRRYSPTSIVLTKKYIKSYSPWQS